MNKVSRDVLDETKTVLCELIGYLGAVNEKQGDEKDPVLGKLSARLDQVVTEIEIYEKEARVVRLYEDAASKSSIANSSG
ncbi:hypothetical protein [Roseobacter sp.]|uniref:hypothetical protein n=1 Tax=Roseobacter sp. TaxID=1907202 RepID=UPI00385BD101